MADSSCKSNSINKKRPGLLWATGQSRHKRLCWARHYNTKWCRGEKYNKYQMRPHYVGGEERERESEQLPWWVRAKWSAGPSLVSSPAFLSHSTFFDDNRLFATRRVYLVSFSDHRLAGPAEFHWLSANLWINWGQEIIFCYIPSLASAWLSLSHGPDFPSNFKKTLIIEFE